jgi:hypothetical protein
MILPVTHPGHMVNASLAGLLVAAGVACGWLLGSSAERSALPLLPWLWTYYRSVGITEHGNSEHLAGCRLELEAVRARGAAAAAEVTAERSQNNGT